MKILKKIIKKIFKKKKRLLDHIYKELVLDVIKKWKWRQTRNSKTLSSFWHIIEFDVYDRFPLLNMRRIFYKWVIWEFKSLLEDCKTVKEFKDNWCSFWDWFADKDGNLNLDYAPREQLDYVINLIKKDPTNRRILINLWNHKNLENLSLPCCHVMYQFYIRDWFIDILWTQRSVDIAIWLPSDMILAALYIIYIWDKTWYKAWKVMMTFWDAHIYEEHYKLLKETINKKITKIQPKYIYNNLNNIEIIDYKPNKTVKFKLKL